MASRRIAWLVGAALAAAPASAKSGCGLGKMLELPATMQGMHPLTEVALNGHPTRLIIDSGGFYSMLTPGTAAELQLPRRAAPDGVTVIGIGGSVTPSIGTVRDVAVGKAALHNVEFLVGGSEIGAAGILGQNILGFRDVEFDLGAGMVRLMVPHDCANANLAYWAKPGQAVSALPILDEQDQVRAGLARHIVGTVLVNGQPMKAVFDTGAGLTTMTKAAAARAGVHPGDPGVEQTGAASGIGRRLLRHWVGSFRTVDVGGEQVRNTRLGFADYGDVSWDMLIGADFFLSHRVYVANSQHRMFLTYSGGKVFRLRDPDDDEAPLPVATAAATATVPAPKSASGTAAPPPDETDAAALLRLGTADFARHDLAGAQAAFDAAVKRAPDDPEPLVERARLHMARHQPLLAGADLDAAIRLRPRDPETLAMRAVLRLGANDRAGAHDDVDAAAAAATPQAMVRFELGGLYAELDDQARAIEQDDLWIKAHPADSRRPVALNNRCWARALANRDLGPALADCDAAVHALRDNAGELDSRGLVHLRRGEWAKAIADYDRALAMVPKLGFSLWGRGLAKLASGDAVGGRADLAAAQAADPAAVARARRYGLVPPA